MDMTILARLSHHQQYRDAPIASDCSHSLSDTFSCKAVWPKACKVAMMERQFDRCSHNQTKYESHSFTVFLVMGEHHELANLVVVGCYFVFFFKCEAFFQLYFILHRSFFGACNIAMDYMTDFLVDMSLFMYSLHALLIITKYKWHI